MPSRQFTLNVLFFQKNSKKKIECGLLQVCFALVIGLWLFEIHHENIPI